MAETSPEQNKSEAATPYKLQRARQRGVIARGRDLGFVSVLVGLVIVAQVQGRQLIALVAQGMRTSFTHTASMAGDPRWVNHAAWGVAAGLAGALLLPALIILAVCIGTEVVQNRGLAISFEPLKPDFTRLNPATGLKKFFSPRMLKEALKSVIKFMAYAGAAYLFVANIAETAGQRARDGADLARLLADVGGRLLLLFILLAAFIAVIDQLLARGEFAKQMRMSRREVTREMREREGEPRFKKRRRQILAEIIKQARAATDIGGADIVITNPTHYAVALRYRPQDGDAPIIVARGRNFWAQRMRDAARKQNIIIIRNPSLARALFNETRVGDPIGTKHFVAVADIYIGLRRIARQQGTTG